MVLLSICIPTYNRKEYLRNTLDSIVSQDIFVNTYDVNIVISDNASSDGTDELVEGYISRFPDKIIYHRNDNNIGFANFERVLSIANGQYLKLNNDTLHFKSGTLQKMLDYIKANLETENILFWGNGNKNIKNNLTTYSDINAFVSGVSYFNTWIGSFGIWKKDFELVKTIFEEKNYTEIPQTFILFQFLENNRNITCVNDSLFESICPDKKGGNYNVAEVFGENYLNLLNDYCEKNLLSDKVYKEEKKLLLKFINHYYFDIDNMYNFKKTGYFRYLLKYYFYNLYFYRFYLKMRCKQYVQQYLQK